jgi:DNA-binding SARP family transcriptional activator/pimeloyl-ACP methyl ester carboxylesterase
MNSTMQVSILGPLVVRSSTGEALVPAGSKQRLLLASLLLHAPRVAAADRLIELVWFEGQPVDPPAALRTQVSRLRALFEAAGGGADLLESEPYGYRLRTDAIELDVDRVEQALVACRDAPDREAALVTLEEALALWRGHPFEEFQDHPAFLPRIRTLQELHQRVRERRVSCLLELGRFGRAIEGAEALIAEDPLRESPHALLMEALYRHGRAGEALAAFQRYRVTLSEELGLDPSPAMRELEHAILTHTLPTHPTQPGSRAARAEALEEAIPRQEIRFCRTADGVRLAYATVGAGPPLVKAANWMNHLEFDWESPVWRRLFRELARQNTLIRYDERASGLSDWDVPSMSLDAWVADLEAVVEACGLERFPLLGISQGCAVCIEYAARHPERVTGLVLHGGYAAGWRADPSYGPADVARRDASIEIVRFGWGEDTPAYRQMFTQTFIPGGTPEEISWFNELERRTVSPENAARFMEAFARIDVRARLAEVHAPTLVLHARGDQRISYHKGMELAAGIPGARFVLLESENHLVLEHEPAFGDWIREAVGFLEQEVHAG